MELPAEIAEKLASRSQHQGCSVPDVIRAYVVAGVTASDPGDDLAGWIAEQVRAGLIEGHQHCPDCGCDPADHTLHAADCQRIGTPAQHEGWFG